eukprot:10775177-Karenia_brevis.AAC.1
MTREQVNAIYGVGRWRPMPRHVVHQSGKWRPIDDGRHAGHNSLHDLTETIVCVSNEFLVLAARAILQK